MGKNTLDDLSREELLAFVVSGGCDGDSGVLDEAVPEYARRIEAEMPCRKKEGV